MGEKHVGLSRGTAPQEWNAVQGIPVPPFISHLQAGEFITALQLFIAQLNLGELQELSQFALAVALDVEKGNALRQDSTNFDPYPSKLVLGIACAVRFPAPWTPEGFATMLSALRYGDWWRGGSEMIRKDRIMCGGDPEVLCQRQDDGGWTVAYTERGVTRIRERPADDYAMVGYLMQEPVGSPFPYGWRYEETLAVDLRGPAQTVATEWTEHAKLPYLQSWFKESAGARGDQ